MRRKGKFHTFLCILLCMLLMAPEAGISVRASVSGNGADTQDAGSSGSEGENESEEASEEHTFEEEPSEESFSEEEPEWEEEESTESGEDEESNTPESSVSGNSAVRPTDLLNRKPKRNLMPKQEASNNTAIKVDGADFAWDGDGSEGNPYTGKLLVKKDNEDKSTVVLSAQDENASFSCEEAGAADSKGSMTIRRDGYGVKTYHIKVTAADGSTVSYYRFRIGWNEYKTYHMVLQTRLVREIDDSGNKVFDDTADLSGLEFSMYESEEGGAWVPVTGEQKVKSEYSNSYRDYRVYFQSISGASVFKKYRVQLEENDRYSMEPVEVEPNNINYNVSKDYFLDLTAKPVSADNVDITVAQGKVVWEGSGQQGDPWTGTLEVGTNTSSMNIVAVNGEAQISYNGESKGGSISIPLPYGTADYVFEVHAVDKTTIGYYKLTVTRPKFTPLPPSNLKPESPTSVGGTDGKITGLDPAKIYEYRLEGSSTYMKAASGSTEITGLAAGVWLVRFAETDTRYASADSRVTIKEPVVCDITLPEGNIPEDVEILECPSSVLAGHPFTMKLKIPAGRLLDRVKYTAAAGGMEISSSFPENAFQYEPQPDGTVLVTIRTNVITRSAKLEIILKEGYYYQVFWDNSDLHTDISLEGQKIEKNGTTYFKEGTALSVTAKVKGDWIDYARITGLEALKKGTQEPAGGTLVSQTDDLWKLTLAVNGDLEIRYGVEVYPADFTGLDEVTAKIASIDLKDYVDNEAKETLQSLLRMETAYRKRTLKEQDAVDMYVIQLRRAFDDLVRKPDETKEEEPKEPSGSSKDESETAAEVKRPGKPESMSGTVQAGAQGYAVTATIPAAVLDRLVSDMTERYDVNSAVLSFSIPQGTLAELDRVSNGGDIILRAVQTADPSGNHRPAYAIVLVSRKNGVETPICLPGGKTIGVRMAYSAPAAEQQGLLTAFVLDAAGRPVPLLRSGYVAGWQSVIFEFAAAGIYGIGYDGSAVPADIAGNEALQDILFAVGRGLLDVGADGSFRPSEYLTRAELSVALGRLAGIDHASYVTGTFADVEVGSIYAPYVNWAVKMGIMNPVGEGLFAPHQAVNRQQLAASLQRYVTATGKTLRTPVPAKRFDDQNKISNWAVLPVRSMQRAGIMKARTGNLFEPGAAVTRAEAAGILRRYVEATVLPQVFVK